MLNYFKRERMAICVRAMQNFFAKYFHRQATEEDRVSKIEAYLSIVYKLLIWEDPFLSGVAFLVAHILFWVIISYELRLYGVLFLSVLVMFVIDTSFDNINTQVDRSSPLRTIRETVRLANASLSSLAALRRDHPGTFCVCMCTGFLVLSIIGRTVSGFVLTYLGLLTVLVVPGLVHRLPPELLTSIQQAVRALSTNEGVLAENELFPAHADDGLIEEKDADADCDSLKTDHTADSYTHSFISGVTSMPSYLDAEGSLDGLEEEDLEFTSRVIPDVTASNHSSESSDGEHKDIRFEASHFNRDSSSSDDDQNYEQGLTFSELDAGAAPGATGSATAAAAAAKVLTQQLSAELLSNLGSSLVGAVLQSAAQARAAPRRSDSDSDFEIIDTEEVQSDET